MSVTINGTTGIETPAVETADSIQIGNDATSSNNFTIYQPSTPDGTLRIGVGNADSPTEVARFNSNGMVGSGTVTLVDNVSVGTGTSFTASGLDLSEYKFLILSMANIRNGGNDAVSFNSSPGTTNSFLKTVSGGNVWITLFIDLTEGTTSSQTMGNTTTQSSCLGGQTISTGITTSSTSVTVYSYSAFSSGTYSLYGVK